MPRTGPIPYEYMDKVRRELYYAYNRLGILTGFYDYEEQKELYQKDRYKFTKEGWRQGLSAKKAAERWAQDAYAQRDGNPV